MDDTPGRLTNDADDVTRRTEDVSGNAAGDSGDADERTRRIRSEIAETRVEMTETIDAIQEKLTPRNIVASATDRVKNAATERVRDMADTASQTAQQAMDYTRDVASGMTDRARQNPLPLALIGLGAAWLIAGRASDDRRARGMRRDQREYNRERDYGREYGGERSRDETLYGDQSDSGLMARIRSNPIPAALAGVGLSWLAFSSSQPRDRQYAGGWGDASGEGGWTGQGASRTREYASDATESMRRMMRRRQSQFQHMVQDNPLLVGCGALMLGAAFGMAVPETETENELMGQARDNVVGRAREMARDAASQVQDAAGTVAEAAGKIVGKSEP